MRPGRSSSGGGYRMYGAAIEVVGRADLGQENGLEVLRPILANGDGGGGA